ncbi:hypothetical protein RvY_06229 [Ramazzottius varieornatus]|uniref:G-protein coupled receptors family 1 profile domain-containing protein n=1 Tax=Ramazzottius varieornatus TaxID=947166 RepID=A0A1D1V7I1_RAMVA|nr:hypothetical protein RvY_06229 [Ramazzottius varieornatus]
MASPRLRSPFNYYLLDIAVHDFLTGAIDLPYYAVFTYYGYWPLSDTHCTIWMWFDYCVDIIRLWGLVGVLVDCLWAVVWPLSYRLHNTLKKSYVIIISGWFVTYASMLPGFIYTRTHFANQSINRTCL